MFQWRSAKSIGGDEDSGPVRIGRCQMCCERGDGGE